MKKVIELSTFALCIAFAGNALAQSQQADSANVAAAQELPPQEQQQQAVQQQIQQMLQQAQQQTLQQMQQIQQQTLQQVQQIQAQAQQQTLQFQEQALQIQAQNSKMSAAKSSSTGLQTRFNLNRFSFSKASENKNIRMGTGIGGGMITRIPVNDNVTVSPEISLCHRELYSYSDRDEYATEFAFSFVPVMIQVSPVATVPLYAAIGIQVDIPFFSNYYFPVFDNYNNSNDEERKKIDGRAGYDLNLSLGFGYNVTKAFVVDFRSAIGILTKFSSKSTNDRSYNRASLTQFGIGIIYYP